MSLYRGRELGCRVCMLLWDRTSEKQRQYMRDREGDVFELSNSHHYWGHMTRDDAYNHYRVIIESGNEPEQIRIDLALEPVEKLPEACTYRPTVQVSSIAALQLARSWYTRCRTQHIRCNREVPRLYVPSRLVHIGMTDKAYWRLWEAGTEGLGCVEYFTLSHCWGNVPVLQLKSSNLEAMKKGMPITSLPRTFQDVIHVARTLGATYIWIDSLCIMQDSLGDWKQESARMKDVYSSSACNISATAAIDSTKGCLYERTERSTDQLWTVKAGPWADSKEYIVLDLHTLAAHVRDAPLSQRAWVTQERFLSPRTLHMGRSQIFWECNKGLACESWPSAIPRAFEDMFGTMFRNIEETLRKTLDSSLTKQTSESTASVKLQYLAPTYTLWGLVVKHYTQCKLTKPDDKLVALSGIAKLFQEYLPSDTYLVGLWKNDLAHGLLWRSVSYAPSPLTLMPGRAPSWSWASVDGTVMAEGREFVMSDEAILIKIVNVQTTANPISQAVEGTVALTGMLFETNIEECFPGEVSPTVTLIPKRSSSSAQSLRGYVYPDSEVRKTFSQRTFFCLPVHEFIWRQSHCLNGLMLVPVGGSKTKFVRIGLWSTTISHVEKNSRVFGVIVTPFGDLGRLDSTVPQQTIEII